MGFCMDDENIHVMHHGGAKGIHCFQWIIDKGGIRVLPGGDVPSPSFLKGSTLSSAGTTKQYHTN